MAAVIPTTSGRSWATASTSSAKTPVQVGPPPLTARPVNGSKTPDLVEVVVVVVLGRTVPVALAGDGMDDHRAREVPGPAQHVLELDQVMTVDRARGT